MDASPTASSSSPSETADDTGKISTHCLHCCKKVEVSGVENFDSRAEGKFGVRKMFRGVCSGCGCRVTGFQSKAKENEGAKSTS